PPPTTARPAPCYATPTRRPGHQTLSSTRYPPDHESAPWCPAEGRRARPQARRRAKHRQRVGEFLWFRPRLPATALSGPLRGLTSFRSGWGSCQYRIRSEERRVGKGCRRAWWTKAGKREAVAGEG